jgi:SAM-dependent methyltransferase
MKKINNFWKIRSEKFDRLEWIKRENFLKSFIEFCQPLDSFIALDLGSGTGIVTRGLSPKVNRIIGIDISKEMIDKAPRNDSNVDYQLMNAEKLSFPDEYFDLMTARMVFHHIEYLDKAMQEAYRVLKEGRLMTMCEGVPPDKSVRERYIEIFKLKEKRHTFFQDDLVGLYERAGFRNISVKPYFMRQVSMRNWLNNSGLSDEICEEIVRLHLETDENFKKTYNMKINPEDILFDWKFIFISGVK